MVERVGPSLCVGLFLSKKGIYMTLNQLELQLQTIHGLQYQIGAQVNDEWKTTTESGGADSFAFALLNRDIPFYEQGGMTVIGIKKLSEMEPKELEPTLLKGLNVVQITRVTGYFTTIKSWNKGKIGELKDRHREVGLN